MQQAAVCTRQRSNIAPKQDKADYAIFENHRAARARQKLT